MPQQAGQNALQSQNQDSRKLPGTSLHCWICAIQPPVLVFLLRAGEALIAPPARVFR